MECKRVAIVGGLGRMGALMTGLFRDAGHEVAVADSSMGPISWQEVAANDVVVLAVPISTIDGVVRSLGPVTREDGLVLDIASLKDAPVRSMLAHCKGEVVGTHPLFGPSVSSLEEQLVFVCPARSNRWMKWVRSFFEENGAIVREIDPVKHDRLMGTVQVLRHALVFCFGRTLMRLDYDLSSDFELSGPWFSRLMEMVRNQVGENPDLYAELAFPNPATAEVISCFAETVKEVCGSYLDRDRNGLISKINELASYLATSGTTPGK